MADPSPDRIRTMVDSIVSGNLKKCSLMLKAGVPAGGRDGRDSFLALAARFAQDEIFELLVERGADLEEPELLDWAVDGDGGRGAVSLTIVRRILDQAKPDADAINSALRIASVSGNIQVVEELLKHGADPNTYDESYSDFPLRNAVEQGHRNLVELLLKHGAKPDRYQVKIEDDELDEVYREFSLVDFAKQFASPDIVRLLQ